MPIETLSRRNWLLALAAQAACVPALAQVKVPYSVESSGQDFVTPQTQQAIDKGLRWLSLSQHEKTGGFGQDGEYKLDAGVSALAGLAFLAAGQIPGRGIYGETVERVVNYLLGLCDATGFISAETSRSHGPMYGHGFATLFLAEAYGMTAGAKPRGNQGRSDEVKDKLKLAVSLIVNSQNDEGGWRYYPVRKEADISVTVCQIMALRAARNAGLEVPKSTADRCIEYVKKCQANDGGFRYQPRLIYQSAFPRSAAGIVALYSAGVYKGRELERGLDYLLQFLPEGNIFRHESHYFYGQYYAVQAMWMAGGDYWKKWYPAIRDELLARQDRDGSWKDPQLCTEYGTAMALLVLQMPNNYLPIFRR